MPVSLWCKDDSKYPDSTQFESETKDTVTSGSYVVLETKHMFSQNKYDMYMTCSRLTQSTDETIAIGPNA